MGRKNRKRVAAPSDTEIRATVESDPHIFVPDRAWWKRAKVVVPARKGSVSLRLDADVLDWFRRQGRSDQTRIDAVLRSYRAAQSTGRVEGGKGRERLADRERA